MIKKIVYYILPFLKSKSASVRLMCAQYFEVLLKRATELDQSTRAALKMKEEIETHQELFDYFFIKATEDQSSEVRDLACISF